MPCNRFDWSYRPALYTILSTVVFSITLSQQVLADDFRVESKVYIGAEGAATSTNLTLFHKRVAYDFGSGGREITVFDPSSSRMILLDLDRKVKTVVNTDELLQYARWIRQQSSETNDALLKFAVSPNFEITSGDANRWKFAGAPLTYRVEGIASPNDEKAAAYRDFCDWFSRLNVMLHPGGIPPFARMAVNAHLEQNKAVPKEIRVNYAPHKRFANREFHARSTHKFHWGLLDSDSKKIDDAQSYMATFRDIPLEKYREKTKSNPE